MDQDALEDDEFREKVKNAWTKGWNMTPIQTVAWSLAWGKVRECYVTRRSEQQSERSKLQEEKIRLEQLRIRMANTTPTTMEKKEYRALENRRMAVLVTGDGEQVEDEDHIKQMVNQFMTNLFKKQQETTSKKEKGARILRLIDRKVSPEKNIKTLEEPSAEEVGKLVHRMAKGKAPGLDGVTCEVVVKCWSWVGESCVNIVQHFWETGELGASEVQGLIKLLPKNEEKQFIKNWRPISLLPFLYRLVSKILADRIKQIIPRLVDEEQTGFVEGRSIVDNVISLKLGQDIAVSTKQATLFCKLDFVKAFDRIEHIYIWDTLAAMDFHPRFIYLLQGLIATGRSKVSINGELTDSFALERGVRQGCSVSPLLFALSTQPLMKLMREEEKCGRLTCLGIPRGKTMLHRLFVDDSGEAVTAEKDQFDNLQRTIEDFEDISGAQLNINKSVVIPMVNTIPEWLDETGCTILKEQEKITYLGCQIGHNMTEKEHARSLAGKLTKKLANWTHRFLTWPGRVMLLRHVLRAIPIYHFLSIGLNDSGYKQLESVCRYFLWGAMREGKAQCPLIAWDRITCSRPHGGLLITPFDVSSVALNMKLIARLLAGDNSEWSDMIRYYIRQESRKKKYIKETKWWSAEKALLLLPSILSKDSLTLKHLMKAWKRIRTYLRFDATKLLLPGSIMWKQVQLLTERYIGEAPFEIKKVAPVLKLLRCETLMNVADGTGSWIDVRQTARHKGIYISTEAEWEVSNLQRWLQKVELSPGGLQDSKSWRWDTEQSKWSGWNRPNQFWSKLMISSIPPPAQPSNSWNIRPSEDFWSKLWLNLWQCRTKPKIKLWTWKVLQQGFFTGARALRMQVADGVCKRCLQEVKTIPHMMKDCPEVRRYWILWTQVRHTTGETRCNTRNLLEELKRGIECHNRNPTWLHTIVAITSNCWKDRNNWVFRNKRSQTSLNVSLREAQQTIEADMQESGSEECWTRRLEGLRTIRSWLQTEVQLHRRRSVAQQIDAMLEGDRVIPIATQNVERLIIEPDRTLSADTILSVEPSDTQHSSDVTSEQESSVEVSDDNEEDWQS
ncbi:hypothetical protein R1sor_008295 [Riccia sorocarpa]|uniref:Reverse transcriptase domain-containing protein n=1 Tax=Riccia sorocarpa TaxID=122646 RepID=A0ABD3HV79_9MARC